MSLFIGSNAGETITPGFVSPSVAVVGAPNRPSAAVDFIFGGGGDDVVAGGGGNDFAFLGAGNDQFIWNPGDGSDFVDGGKGFDTMVFNGSGANEKIDISAGPLGLATFTRDAANITMTLNKVERIEFAALGGEDRIAVHDLGATAVTEVAIDLGGVLDAAGGDGKSDQVSADGTNAGESIEVLASGSSASVVGLGALLTITDAEAGDRLAINALGGNDTISAATVLAGTIGLTLDGGAGDDTIIGGANADLLIGGAGNDTVRGGRGADVARLGDGDDLFTWDPGEGSDVVEGQAGFDTMLFNGAGVNENIDVSANGERVTFFRDFASITMDLNDVERIAFNALGGADNVVVKDLSGTDATEIAIDLAGTLGGSAGDGQVDQITLNGTQGDDAVQVSLAGSVGIVNGLAATVSIDHFEADKDLLLVKLGAGDDIVDASLLPAGAIGLVADGGDGDDGIIGGGGDDVLLGGAGDDVLLGSDGDDVLDGGDGDDLLIGGAGDDLFLNGEILEGFVAGAGTEDRIDLRGVADAGDFDSIVARSQDVGGSAVLDLGNGDQMTLLNVSVAALSADDFLL
ncbi:MAG TPA: hypothetical protein VLD36_08785 [Burkholderiales bacterium]|nr:hypothetical protein [Burkholderiales bacterium]